MGAAASTVSARPKTIDRDGLIQLVKDSKISKAEATKIKMHDLKLKGELFDLTSTKDDLEVSSAQETNRTSTGVYLSFGQQSAYPTLPPHVSFLRVCGGLTETVEKDFPSIAQIVLPLLPRHYVAGAIVYDNDISLAKMTWAQINGSLAALLASQSAAASAGKKHSDVSDIFFLEFENQSHVLFHFTSTSSESLYATFPMDLDAASVMLLIRACLSCFTERNTRSLHINTTGDCKDCKSGAGTTYDDDDKGDTILYVPDSKALRDTVETQYALGMRAYHYGMLFQVLLETLKYFVGGDKFWFGSTSSAWCKIFSVALRVILPAAIRLERDNSENPAAYDDFFHPGEGGADLTPKFFASEHRRTSRSRPSQSNPNPNSNHTQGFFPLPGMSMKDMKTASQLFVNTRISEGKEENSSAVEFQSGDALDDHCRNNAADLLNRSTSPSIVPLAAEAKTGDDDKLSSAHNHGDHSSSHTHPRTETPPPRRLIARQSSRASILFQQASSTRPPCGGHQKSSSSSGGGTGGSPSSVTPTRRASSVTPTRRASIAGPSLRVAKSTPDFSSRGASGSGVSVSVKGAARSDIRRRRYSMTTLSTLPNGRYELPGAAPYALVTQGQHPLFGSTPQRPPKRCESGFALHSQELLVSRPGSGAGSGSAGLLMTGRRGSQQSSTKPFSVATAAPAQWQFSSDNFGKDGCALSMNAV